MLRRGICWSGSYGSEPHLVLGQRTARVAEIGLPMGCCREAQLRYASDAELDVNGRAGDRSRTWAALLEAARRDFPVQRVAWTYHGCVVGAGEIAGADGTAETARAGGRVIPPGVCGAGVEGDCRVAGGAQRELDGCELIAGGARLNMAGEPQLRVVRPRRLNRLAWSAGDAVDQRRDSGSRRAAGLWPAQRDAQRGFAGMAKRDLDRAGGGAAIGAEPGEPPDGVAAGEGYV